MASSANPPMHKCFTSVHGWLNTIFYIPCQCIESPTDGQYVTQIHHVSHMRNMRETCAKRAKHLV